MLQIFPVSLCPLNCMIGLQHQNMAAVCTVVLLTAPSSQILTCPWHFPQVGHAVISPTFSPQTCVSLCFLGPYLSPRERQHDEGDFSSHCEILSMLIG